MEEQLIQDDELPERDDIPSDPYEHERQFQAHREVGFMPVLLAKSLTNSNLPVGNVAGPTPKSEV